MISNKNIIKKNESYYIPLSTLNGWIENKMMSEILALKIISKNPDLVRNHSLQFYTTYYSVQIVNGLPKISSDSELWRKQSFSFNIHNLFWNGDDNENKKKVFNEIEKISDFKKSPKAKEYNCKIESCIRNNVHLFDCTIIFS